MLSERGGSQGSPRLSEARTLLTISMLCSRGNRCRPNLAGHSRIGTTTQHRSKSKRTWSPCLASSGSLTLCQADNPQSMKPTALINRIVARSTRAISKSGERSCQHPAVAYFYR
jgi:hypothetical protein